MYENKDLQDEFNKMFEYTCKLESLLRYKDKDIDRLSYLNQYLTESQKKRDEIILDSQKEIQRLKQLIILYQKKVSEGAKKEFKELTNLSAQDLETTFASTQKAALSNNQRKLPSSRPQTKRPAEQATKTKNQNEQKIPQNRQVKPIGSQNLLDIRVADSMQFMIDNANQDNKKGKNFFALDEDETITSSLKENESFKFLSKITRDEGLFSDFISNLNYRGTYQLLESIRLIVRDYEANIFSLIKMKRMLTGVSKIAGASDTLVNSDHSRQPLSTLQTPFVRFSTVIVALRSSTTNRTTNCGRLLAYPPKCTGYQTRTVSQDMLPELPRARTLKKSTTIPGSITLMISRLDTEPKL